MFAQVHVNLQQATVPSANICQAPQRAIRRSFSISRGCTFLHLHSYCVPIQKGKPVHCSHSLHLTCDRQNRQQQLLIYISLLLLGTN